MRRLMTTLLVGCLLGTISVPVIAQEPTAPPSFGGRVEVFEHGIAVTFPEDWQTFDLTDDIDARVESIVVELGDVFPAGPAAMVAYLESRSEASELIGLSLDEQACDLRVVPSRHVDLRDPVFQARLDTAIRAEQGIEDYTGLTPVDLPAGPAISYGWVQLDAGADGQDLPHSGYMVDGGDLGVVFTCEGMERLDDEWLAIAETIEFMPQPEPPSSVGIGGRVEVLEGGFALTFPDDWVWARHSELGTDALVEGLATATDPGYAEEQWLLVSELEETLPLIAWPRHGDGSCMVGVYRTDRPLERVVADAVTYIEANDALYPDGVVLTELDLGGVDVVRLDYTQGRSRLAASERGDAVHPGAGRHGLLHRLRRGASARRPLAVDRPDLGVLARGRVAGPRPTTWLVISVYRG